MKDVVVAVSLVCVFLVVVFLTGIGISESHGRSRQVPTTVTSPEGHTFYVTKDMKVIHTIPCDKCEDKK